MSRIRWLKIEGSLGFPVIIERYPLAEVPEAMRYLGAGHPHGKIVITVVEEER
ncbi:MAG: zinc-binding dehydrogenase [Anaerolineales bacterium]